MLTPEDIQILRQAQVSDDRIMKVVQEALNLNLITVPIVTPASVNFAGGTNFCPNSDFAYSHKAATVPATLPSDAATDNQEVYRVFKQVKDADIGSTRVSALETDLYKPKWDKVAGTISLGYDGVTSGGDFWDIAIQFTNNWLVNNRKRFIRFTLSLDGDTPLPTGVRVYAGYWVKRLDATQGWVDGSDFELTYHADTVGTQHFRYKVIAKTDSGFTIESAILDVPDAPDVVDADNPVRVMYGAASGFIEFITYRETVATGVVDLIARDRNDSRLFAYDTGQSLGVEQNGFPSAAVSVYRGYQEVAVDAVDIAVQKTYHNLTIPVPANLDNSNIAVEGTYLRIGLLGNTAFDGQVLIDTVWESDTFNVWSPSPFDNYGSPPSTTMVTAPPTAGGGGGDPPIGGGSCLWVEHDALLANGEWKRLSDARPYDRMYNGDKGNVARDFIEGFTTQYYAVQFECGLVLLASPSHRFIRSADDGSGLLVTKLKVGDELWGGRWGEHLPMEVTGCDLIHSKHPIPVKSPEFREGAQDKAYAVGDAETGWFVFNHNAKQVDI